MPKVSVNKLTREFEIDIFQHFPKALSGLRREDDMAGFLHAFLTHSEKVMLSKRFMIAVFLTKEYDFILVSRILKVSKMTIYAVQREMRRAESEYKKAVDIFLRSEKHGIFLQKLDAALSKLVLPMKGSPSSMRRWKKALNT